MSAECGLTHFIIWMWWHHGRTELKTLTLWSYIIFGSLIMLLFFLQESLWVTDQLHNIWPLNKAFFYALNSQVTGGSSGIGKCIAMECYRQGAFITLVARDEVRKNLILPIIPLCLTKLQLACCCSRLVWCQTVMYLVHVKWRMCSIHILNLLYFVVQFFCMWAFMLWNFYLFVFSFDETCWHSEALGFLTDYLCTLSIRLNCSKQRKRWRNLPLMTSRYGFSVYFNEKCFSSCFKAPVMTLYVT